MNKIFILHIILAILCCANSFAQQRIRILGKVIDEKNDPVGYALISVEGQSAYTMSENDGKYNLICHTDDSVKLVVSLIGYRTKKYTLLSPKDSTIMDLKIISKSNELDVVSVTSTRRQTDQMQHINAQHTKTLASPTGNAVEELVKTQMGVSSHNEMSSQYNVRGGSYDENCVYLNGVEIYRPLLVRSGEQEGLSVINSNMVEEIHFSAGGFAAKYGDKMSSVLDIKYKRPEKFEASLSGSLMGADTYVGFGNKKFSMMNGFRYKTTRLLLNSFDTKGEYKPNFLDYQNYTSWRPNDHWTIDFIGNISDNHYNFKPEDRETKFGTFNDAKNFRVYFDGHEKDYFKTFFGSLNISHHFSKNTTLSWITSAYSTKEQETYDISGEYWLNETAQQTQLGVGSYIEHARNFLVANVLQSALHFQAKIKKHNLALGFNWKSENVKENSVEWEKRDSAGYNMPSNAERLQLIYQLRAKTEVKSNRIEMFVQDTYKFQNDAGLFTLNYGIRGSHWDWNDEWLISPRVSLGLIPKFNENFTFRIATGIYYQSPFYKELRDTITTNGSTRVELNKNIKSQKSFQIILGGDYQFRLGNRPFRLSSEIYYKNLSNLVPYNVNNMRIVYYGKNMTSGYTAGIDFKFFGEFVPGTDSWITLGLMTARQKWNGKYISIPTDQRYNINLFFTDYFPGTDRWKLALKAALADGLPFGAPHIGIRDNSFRAPAYRRVDIGLNYRLYKNERRKPNPYSLKNVWLGIDCFNVLGINNVNSYYWITDDSNNQYAVPNFLTGRMLNVKFTLEF